MTVDRDLLNFAPLLFPVFLIFISVLISRISGWSALAELYFFDGPFEGKRWRFVSARMRWMMGYNKALTVGGNSNGLYLAMFILLRPGHRPLFIPWHDISTKTVHGVLMKYMELRFARVPGLYISLPLHIVDKVFALKGRE